MCQHCSSYYVVALTWSRHHSVCKFFSNFLPPHKNKTEGKKNKTLNITLLQLKTDFFWSDYKLSLQAVLLKRNYIQRQWLISVKTALTLFNIEYKSGGDIRTTSSKTVRSEKTSRETSLWKSSDKRIDYKSFMQCTVFLIYLICLWEKGPYLPSAAWNHNHFFRHSAINCHRKSRVHNIRIQSTKSFWSKRAATYTNMIILMIIIRERI